MEYANYIGAVFLLIILILIFGFWREKRRTVPKQHIEDLRYDFVDNYGNHYAAVQSKSGRKILLKTPEEVTDWNALNTRQKEELINESEKKAAKGLLQRVEINGAIGYLAKGRKIRNAVEMINSQNEKSYD